MSQKILNPTHWTGYNDDPRKKGVDSNFFSCSQKWEVEYLVRVIWQEHPELDESNIRTAIMTVCGSMHGNHPRKDFVEAVMKELNI